MKRLALVTAVALMAVMPALFLTGCGIDRNLVIGKWELVHLQSTGAITINSTSESPDWFMWEGYLELRADGTFRDVYGAVVIEGTWRTSRQNIIFTQTVDFFGTMITVSHTWRVEINGDQLSKTITQTIPQIGTSTETWTYTRVI